MLTSPKALVDHYGDHQTVDLDVPGIIELGLDGVLSGLRLDLELIDRAGLASHAARSHVEKAFERVMAPLPLVQGIDAGPDRARCWTALALADGSWWRVEAPLSRGQAPEAGPLWLCDAPEYLAIDRDTRVPLELSDSMRGWHLWLGDAPAWKPMARVDGVVRGMGRNAVLRVLRIQARVPAPPSRVVETDLVGEAFHAAAVAELEFKTHRRDELLFARCRIEELREQQPDADDDALWQAAAAKAHLSEHAAAEMARFEHNPTDSGTGYWIGLVALLPECMTTGRLSPATARVILKQFDDSFSDDWRAAARYLEGAMPLRLTGPRLDALRQRLTRVLGLDGPEGDDGDDGDDVATTPAPRISFKI
jgi:hypothetical protein